MQLSDILYKVNIRSVTGSTGVEVNDIQIDSRKIKPGGLFVAVKGAVMDGHQFIEKAIENGAAVIVYEDSRFTVHDARLTYVQAENSAAAAARPRRIGPAHSRTRAAGTSCRPCRRWPAR